MRPLRGSALAVLCALLLAAAPAHGAAQRGGVSREMSERGRKILEQIRKDLLTHYYDTTFGGRDLDAAYAAAQAQLDAAKDNNQLFATVAQFVSQLDDSHTHFYPPDRAATIEYGYGLQFIGDTAFVMWVAKESDAEKKGLKRGDAVLRLDRFAVNRKSWDILQYVYRVLSPRPVVRLLVRSADGSQREVDITAKITKRPRIIDYNDPSVIATLLDEIDRGSRAPQHFYVSLGDSVLIWRMPSFVVPENGIEDMMKIARKHRAVVLDLRNNGGGYVHIERQLLSHFFDRDLFVGMTHRRGRSDSVVIKPADVEGTYRGMLIILVNGNSASASEMTARVMQLEGRGIIVGDRTMGAVVTSRTYVHEVGFGRVMDYALQVSVMDVTMADGQRLEKIGVTPDHLVLPTGDDLANFRDPQLAKALELAGYRTTAVEAARLFRSDREEAEGKR